MRLKPEDFTCCDEHAEFTIHGRTYLIDHDDVELVCGRTWYPCGAGEHTYLGTKIAHSGGYKNVTLHAFLFGMPTNRSLSVDHVNRNKCDNRRSNLRLATRSMQSLNREHKSGKSYRGVYQYGATYRASICVEGVRRHLGTYHTPEDAAIAHDAALYEITQDKTLLNLPDRLGETPRQTRELSDEVLISVLNLNNTRAEISSKFGLDLQTISKLRQGWRPKYYRGAL